MRGSGAVATLVGARCFVEGVTFAALAAVAHAWVLGRAPLAVVPATLVLFGVGLLLVALMGELGAERRSATILVVTLALGVAWGLTMPMRDPDGFAVLSRLVVFGLLAEAYLWRIVSVARSATRWTDARNAMVVAAFAVALAVLAPGEIDRAPFAALVLLAIAASGLALSLARTTEELELARGTIGRARASSATSATVVVAFAAIVVALLVPAVQDLLGRLGEAVAPLFARILYLLVLPFAYLAGYLVEVIRPILQGRWRFPPPPTPITPEQDAEMLRQMEETRPYVFGAVELIIVAVAVMLALVLFERMLRERRLDLPEGVTLEREHAEGMSLRETLRSLRPRRAARARPPRDDGTAAAAIRIAYWRFLALARSRGLGWRETSETPSEHGARVASAEPRWREGLVVVRAFEDLRYGEVDPDDATVARARGALRALEAQPR